MPRSRKSKIVFFEKQEKTRFSKNTIFGFRRFWPVARCVRVGTPHEVTKNKFKVAINNTIHGELVSRAAMYGAAGGGGVAERGV